MADAPGRRTYGDLALYRRLLGEAKPFAPGLLGIFSLRLLGAPLALLVPLPVKIVVDHVLGSEPMPPILERLLPASLVADPQALLVAAALAVVGLALLAQVQELFTWLLETYVGQKLILGFRSHLLDHLQRLSLTFHDRTGVADAIYRLQLDAPAIEGVAITGLIPFLTSLVKVAVLVYATARLDLPLALIALGGGPVLLGLTELFRRRLRKSWAAVRKEESSAMAAAQESLGALRVVKAFGAEQRERGRFYVRAEAGLRAAMRAVFAHGLFDLFAGLVTGVIGAGVLYLGARHVQEGVVTLGELLLVIAYLSQLVAPLRDLGTRMGSLQQALASAERVFQVLDEAPEAAERAGAKALDRAAGTFTFEDVAFAYPDGTRIFAGVDLEIPAGSRVGVAGPTGSGKSTLLSLLPRFYDPTAGTIRLDGEDLRDLKLADLRRQFSIVLQDNVLFAGTLRENIAYGRPDASMDEIQAAARAAAAHDFIARNPDGYEATVGERGMRLSGGERQRIALARAFLRDAPVLILDEPTSALDRGTEAEVMAALDRLMAGRTTFMIAHRLETLATCDVRLVVKDGAVHRVEAAQEEDVS